MLFNNVPVNCNLTLRVFEFWTLLKEFCWKPCCLIFVWWELRNICIIESKYSKSKSNNRNRIESKGVWIRRYTLNHGLSVKQIFKSKLHKINRILTFNDDAANRFSLFAIEHGEWNWSYTMFCQWVEGPSSDLREKSGINTSVPGE